MSTTRRISDSYLKRSLRDNNTVYGVNLWKEMIIVPYLNEEYYKIIIKDIITKMRDNGKHNYDGELDNPIILIRRYEKKHDLEINISGFKKRIHVDANASASIKDMFSFIDETGIRLPDEKLISIGMSVFQMWNTILDEIKDCGEVLKELYLSNDESFDEISTLVFQMWDTAIDQYIEYNKVIKDQRLNIIGMSIMQMWYIIFGQIKEFGDIVNRSLECKVHD